MSTLTTLKLATGLAALLAPLAASADSYGYGYGHGYGYGPDGRINQIIHSNIPTHHYGYASYHASPSYAYAPSHHYAPSYQPTGYASPCAARTAYGGLGAPVTRVTHYGCGSTIVTQSVIVPPVTGRYGYQYGYGSQHYVSAATGQAAMAAPHLPQTGGVTGQAPVTDAALNDGASLREIGPPVFFGSGSSILNAEAVSALRSLALELSTHRGDPEVSFVVSGFSDAAGDEETNRMIAAERAQVVITYLVTEFDLPADRFSILAVGEDEANLSPEPNSDFHRRVTIAIRTAANAALEDPKGHVPQQDPQTAGHTGYADPTCTVPSAPYGHGRTQGTLVAVSFNDLDDYGGGRLVTYCDTGH